MSYAAKSVMLPLWAGAVDPGILSVTEFPGFYQFDEDSPFVSGSMYWEAKPIYTQLAIEVSFSGNNFEIVPLGGGFTREITESYSYTHTTTVTRQSISELMSGVTVEQQELGDQATLRSEGPLRVSRSAGGRNLADSGKAVFLLGPSRARKYTVEDLGNPPTDTSEVEFNIMDIDFQSLWIGSGSDPKLINLVDEVIGTQTIEEFDPDHVQVGPTQEYDIELDLTVTQIFTQLETYLLDEWAVHDLLRATASMGLTAGVIPAAPRITDWTIDISAWTKAHWHDWTTAPDHPFTFTKTENGVTTTVKFTLS